jgi:chromosome transmission fidelity protein 18
MFILRTPPFKILAQRLTEICKWEDLRTDLRTLMALCELTGGDIRSCLNTLQFIRLKSRTLDMSMLSSLDLGQKDMSRGLFKVWEAIFTTPSAKQINRLSQTQTKEQDNDHREIKSD